MPLQNLLKLNISYHKLYRQLDTLRIEDFLPENKSVQQKIQQQQTNKQTKTIMSTPKGTQLHAWILIEYFWHALWKTRGESGYRTKFKCREWRLFYPNVCWTTADKLINLSNITSVKRLSGWEYKTKFHQVRSERLCFTTWKYNYLSIHIQPPSHFNDQICWPSENSLSFVSERLRQTWQSRTLTDHPSMTAKYKQNTNSRTLIIWIIIIIIIILIIINTGR